MTAKSWPEVETKITELEQENKELKAALKDIIYICCSGRVGHIGDCCVYTAQIDCKTIDNCMGLVERKELQNDKL